MHVRDLGPMSRPVIVMLHGSPIPAQHLLPLAQSLSHSHRVLLPDLPGYGRSDPTDGDPLVEGEKQLEAYLRELDVHTIDLVGFGLGAYRALRLALAGRLRVRRLVCASGFAGLTDDERRRNRTYADVLHCGGDLCDTIIQLGLSAAQRDADPALVERMRAWIHEVPVETWAAELVAMAHSEDLLPKVGKLEIPMLLVAGGDDRLVPPVKSEQIAACARQALVERLPCGHLPLDEIPDRVMPRLRGFLT